MENFEELDLGVLDELTQEDKIFLIHQIEDLNKNIRYCHNSSPYNIFQEDENQNIQQSEDGGNPRAEKDF